MDGVVGQQAQAKLNALVFQTNPCQYRHWQLSFDGPVATVTMSK